MNAIMTAIFMLPQTEITFNPSKDIEVKAPVMHIECSRDCTLLESANCLMTMNTHTCDDYVMNGVKVAGYSWREQLVRTGKNTFALPVLKASYKDKKNARICVRLETNLNGSDLENSYDSNSLLSYCTNKTSSWEDRPNDIYYITWNNHRAQTFQEFMSLLQRPLDVRFK